MPDRRIRKPRIHPVTVALMIVPAMGDRMTVVGRRRRWIEVLSDRFGQLIITRLVLRLLIFDETQERIVQWIEPSATA